MLTATRSSIEHESSGIRWRRRALGVGVALAVIMGALWGFYPLADARARLDRVPARGARFESADLPLSEMERTVFSRVSLLHRRYVLDGRPFYLTVIDGTRDRHVVHDPRYCFQGAGWQVTNEKKLPLAQGHATWLTTTQAGEEAQVVYWFTDGVHRHSSAPKYWWQTTLRRMTLGRAGAEPLLVVLQSSGAAQPNWTSAVNDVIAILQL